MAIVHAIGIPENDSERKAIKYLVDNLPDDDYVVFHNLEIPNRHGLPYEYDIIVVGEFAVYVIDVKGYQGVIKGNASEWELDSGKILHSPIPLLNKKAKIVSSLLQSHSPILNQVWVEPLIIITDDKARIRLSDPQSKRVVTLANSKNYIMNSSNLPILPKNIAHLKEKATEAILKNFRPRNRQHEIQEYRIIDTINRNNLYTTFLAEHKFLQTPTRFILKVYSVDLYASPASQEKHKEWIMRDANALHRMGVHPNIVRAHLPFPWEHNKVVLPLEWTDGYSLRGLLDAGEEITKQRKMEIMKEVCEGLQHAHDHNIIHRDLQPKNIIIPKAGPVKLVNFDCARIEDDDIRTIATRVGRQLDERYVAPEVWENAGAVSVAGDIYAAGIVFFELLTGQTPHQKIKEIFANKRIPKLPSELHPSISSDFDEIILQMCAFKPEDRPKNLKEVADYLSIAE